MVSPVAKIEINSPSDSKDPRTYARSAGFLAPTQDCPGLSCHVANASDDWRNAVEQHLQFIPPAIRAILSAQDIAIVLAGRPTDIGRVSETPDPDDYYKRSEVETAAYYTPDFKAVVLPEYHKSQQSKLWVPLYEPGMVIAHEVAHALDDVLQISAQPEAQDAYAIDKSVLNNHSGYHASVVRDKYGYLLQEGRRGEKESMAEQGSMIWAGNAVCGLQEYDWPFLSAYSKAYMAYVADNYDPAAGLSKTFTRAAARHAENALLQEAIIKDSIGYGLLFEMAARMPRSREDNRFSAGRIKAACIGKILQRQGQEAVEAAYVAYKERVKALNFRFPGF